MELTVLDTNFRSIAIIDVFESLIWTDRFSTCGDFEIYESANDKNLVSLLEDYYLWSRESEHTMIIEDHKITSDIDSGSHVQITGRSLESILDRRIVWFQTVLGGNLQNGVKKLLDDNIINPTDPDRKVSNFIFEASTDPAITGLTIDAQYTGDNLLKAVQELCEAKSIGFKVLLNEAMQFVFKLYAGVDRSYDQIVNPYVVFSPKFDNLLNSNYLQSTKDLKTVTLVAGEGEGTARRTISVAGVFGSGTGLSRRELFTDARDVSSSAPGRNLFDKSKVQSGFINATTGAIETNASYSNSKYGEAISIVSGKSYYLSGYAGAFRYCLFNSDGTYNSYVNLTTPIAWTATITGKMVPLFYNGATDGQLNITQIELGTAATAYIAFNKLDDTEYNAQLSQKGTQNLSEHKKIQSFEGQAETTKIYQYGRDFFMGDILQIANEYGMESRSRVTEVVRSHSTSSIDVVPTFTAVPN